MNNKLILTKMPLQDFVQHTSCKEKESFVSVLYNGNAVQTLSCMPKKHDYLHDIVIGRVDSIAENIHAIFVRISKNEVCYLPYDEIAEAIFTHKISKKTVAIGDELLVQIVRRPMKTKQAALSTRLTITGQYTVVTSATRKKLGISKKLTSDRRKELQTFLSENQDSYFSLDLVARTNCQNAPNDTILSEANMIATQMKQIIEHGPSKTLYSTIYSTPPEYISLIEGSYMGEINEIVTDLPEVHQQICEYFGTSLIEQSIDLRFYEDPYPLYQLYSLKKEFSDALSRKVWLKSGAYLIIDPTEALTVIDVNSGKNEKKNSDEYFLNINLEAAKEIARQLRLRNISGICVIDFIDMKEHSHQDILLSTMRKYCNEDHITTSVVDITKLHLMEVTRKKTTPTLYEQILQDIT